jgi:hypothetical protein
MPALRGYNVSSRSENEIGKHHYLIVPQDEEINVATNFSGFLRAGNTPNNKALILWSFKNSLHYQQSKSAKTFSQIN